MVKVEYVGPRLEAAGDSQPRNPRRCSGRFGPSALARQWAYLEQVRADSQDSLLIRIRSKYGKAWAQRNTTRLPDYWSGCGYGRSIVPGCITTSLIRACRRTWAGRGRSRCNCGMKRAAAFRPRRSGEIFVSRGRTMPITEAISLALPIGNLLHVVARERVGGSAKRQTPLAYGRRLSSLAHGTPPATRTIGTSAGGWRFRPKKSSRGLMEPAAAQN